MKKLLLLGGDHFLIPVVKAAKALGYYVITCDYLPDNVAHKLSDAYIKFSTTDKEGILAAARELGIDGVLTYTDSGAVSAAYVAHHLGLPATGPLESVEILQNKARFRRFLADHGFNAPAAGGYATYEEAVLDSGRFRLPVIVKPVDSAGSKGVTKVESWDGLEAAVSWALNYSPSGGFIIEEWIEKVGCSSDSDCFSYNGVMEVTTFSSQRFDEKASGPYIPAAYTWPSTFTEEQEQYLRSELQRLITLLGMKSSVYNVETRIGTDGKPYIMEVSPRGGGNRLSEIVHFSTGVDIISNACRVAVGDDPVDYRQRPLTGHWAEVILHSNRDGLFDRLEIAPEVRESVVDVDLWVKKGDRVKSFIGANNAIGTLILKFPDERDMDAALKDIPSWLTVVVNEG